MTLRNYPKIRAGVRYLPQFSDKEGHDEVFSIPLDNSQQEIHSFIQEIISKPFVFSDRKKSRLSYKKGSMKTWFAHGSNKGDSKKELLRSLT